MELLKAYNIVNNKKIVIAILILFACIFYMDKVMLGPYADVRIHDSFDTEFARYKVMGNMLLNHGLFAWYPNIAAGMPSYVYHFSPYYIWCLVSIIIPSWVIYTGMILFLMVLAGYGMYWFLKDFLGVSSELSFLGGLIFSLSSQIQPNGLMHLVYNFAFPAFFMCSVIVPSQLKSLRSKLLAFLLIFFIIASSYPVITLPFFFVLQLLVIFFMNFLYKKKSSEMVIRTSLIWAGYIALCVPIIYAIYSYFPLAQRTYQQPVGLLTFLINSFIYLVDFFGNWATRSTLFLIIVGLSPLLFYSWKLRRAFYVVLIPLVFASFFMQPHLSIVTGTIFEKLDLSHLVFTLPFSLTVFAILAIQEFQNKEIPRKWYYLSFSFAFVLLFLYGALRRIAHGYEMFWLNVTIFLLLICIAFLKNNYLNFSLGQVRVKKPLIIIATLFLGSMAVIQCKEYRSKTEYTPYRLYFDSHPALAEIKIKEQNNGPYRVSTLYTYPVIPQDYGMEGVGCRAPISPRYFKEYFKEIIRPQLDTSKKNNKFDTYWYEMELIYRWYEYDMRGKDIRYLINFPLLQMINMKYLISPYYDTYLDSISEKVIISKSDNNMRTGILDRILRHFDSFEKKYCSTFYIYKLKDVLERGYLVQKAVVLPSDKDVLQKMSKLTIKELKSSVFFSAEDSGLPADLTQHMIDSDSKNSIGVEYYGPDKIVFNGFITSPSILVVTNSYDPKWVATVNGEKRKVYRADNAFQALKIDTTGKVKVVLEYKDPMLWKLHWAVPLGLIMIFLSFFI